MILDIDIYSLGWVDKCRISIHIITIRRKCNPDRRVDEFRIAIGMAKRAFVWLSDVGRGCAMKKLSKMSCREVASFVSHVVFKGASRAGACAAS